MPASATPTTIGAPVAACAPPAACARRAGAAMQRAAMGEISMTVQDRRGIEGYVFLAAYIACIPLANWMIGHVGTVCVPQGPCLVPVAPGLMAPSGVLLVGLALVLRDLVQRRLGIAYALAAIAVGAALSGVLAPLPLVIASTSAFLLSELAD